jgi:hypothetical protein
MSGADIPDRAELLRQFLALPRNEQFTFLVKACNAHAAGIKLAPRTVEVPA